jgi:hypothetical protein
MLTELEVLAIVTARLEAAQIAYMLTGSDAMSYYATPRMTRDVDLVVALAESDCDRASTTRRTMLQPLDVEAIPF